jgi:hypothetical protein
VSDSTRVFTAVTTSSYRLRERGGASRGAAEILAAALSTTLIERPLFCDLLAHVPLNLEWHVSLKGSPSSS